MDHSYQPQPQHKLDDLRHSRSRDSGHTSYGQTRSEGLNLNISAALNAQASSRQDSLPSSVPSLSTNPSSEANSPSFLTCPVSTFPTSNLPQSRSFLESCENVDDPLVTALSQAQQRVSTAEHNRLITLPITGSFTSQEMSTLGIQFDPQFDASIRPSYPWSAVFDINEQFDQVNNNAMDPFNMTSNSNVPSFTRSISSTPPQTIFTPEQRELKRQRDLARRESKARMRRDRSTSTSCYNSQNTTPDMIPRTITNYSSTLVASSLKAEASPFPSANYMDPLVAHVPANESPEMFATPFPSMIQNEYNINNYLIGFSAAEPALTSYSAAQSRPHSLSSASVPDSQYYGTTALASHPLSHEHLNSSGETVRVVHSRPKPQCWDHGCNGRQFSTFSNLLRHQREKSGVASKPTCPKCGAEFTRTTARNGHMQHEKCKQRRNT